MFCTAGYHAKLQIIKHQFGFMINGESEHDSPCFLKMEQNSLEEILALSNPFVSQRHKKRVYELLAYLRKCKEDAGTIVILGCKDYVSTYTKPMDEDLFKKNPVSIYHEDAGQMLEESLHYDGAVLVSDDGIITNSGMYIRADPVEVLEEQGIPNGRDLSDRFGFKEKVGTRHCSAKAASYLMPDATIFVLSEESRGIRIFEKGRTIYSPIKSEIVLGEVVAAN